MDTVQLHVTNYTSLGTMLRFNYSLPAEAHLLTVGLYVYVLPFIKFFKYIYLYTYIHSPPIVLEQ